MNKVLIVDASDSDRRLMSGLLVKHGYEPIAVDNMEAAKEEVAKLPPGAVVVTAMKFAHGTALELINWQKREGFSFPVIAIVNNLNGSNLLEVMSDGGAVNVIQRPAIDKQLVEIIGKYAKPESIVIQLDNALIPRRSEKFKEIEQAIERIAQTNANCIIFDESDMGKEQIARQIYLQSSRTQKPITVIEAGSAEPVGLHDPKSDRNEMYNRIKSYFQNAAGGTIILKNIQLLNFEKQSVFMHIRAGTWRGAAKQLNISEKTMIQLRKKHRPVLSNALGENYFPLITVPSDIAKGISTRKKEEKQNKWLPLRGDKDIYYLDFIDLAKLIQNNWEFFKTYFPSQGWISTKIDELYKVRCLIAHNSYAGDDEKDMVALYYKQIVKQIGSHK